MKICPQCRNKFEEDYSFCLQDGTPLVDLLIDSSSDNELQTFAKNNESKTQDQTLILPNNANQSEPSESFQKVESKDQKSHFGMAVAGFAVFGLLLLGTIIGGGYFYMQSMNRGETASVNTIKESETPSNTPKSIGDASDKIIQENANGKNLENANSNNLNENKNTLPIDTKSDSKPTPASKRTPNNIPITPTPKPTIIKTPKPKPTYTPKPIVVKTPTPKPSKTIVNTGQTTGLKILSKPRPGYTAKARANNVRGKVTLRITFLANSRIGNVSAVKGLPDGLTQMAIKAAQGIKFRPPMKNGVPYTTTKLLVYDFVIY